MLILGNSRAAGLVTAVPAPRLVGLGLPVLTTSARPIGSVGAGRLGYASCTGLVVRCGSCTYDYDDCGGSVLHEPGLRNASNPTPVHRQGLILPGLTQ
jgi:hypothetical protein